MGVSRSGLSSCQSNVHRASAAKLRLGLNVKPDPCRADPTASLGVPETGNMGSVLCVFRLPPVSPCSPSGAVIPAGTARVPGDWELRQGEGRAELGAAPALLLPPFPVFRSL